ncbi:hypothetical protein BCR34DRAFT_480610 [Clohesyomyces aquaticus]|uniref:Arrestin-like N-terminal domain-containing protein n=1 Tax=Clohesyomyces aquaticus TaxID=1231657 RepID=A0A1Y1ZVF4_9PLEO|nr:hypothetical protein BCR34DRAFT_480610 [Clohesyomyces aquaticus]
MSAGSPSVRIIVDGDPSRLYRQGEIVRGRVILVAEEQEQVKSLKLNFLGTCISKTTRPFYVSGNDRDANSLTRREYREKTNLFNIERTVLLGYTLGPKKYSWGFEFKFPECTETRHSRWAGRGSRYSRESHALPPSFHLHTDSPGGEAIVSYYIQAKLIRRGMREMKRATQVLAYHPSLRCASYAPRITPRVLYNQTWKPVKDTRTAMDKVLNKVSRKPTTRASTPRIVPTLYYPERISPGQNLPLSLSISNSRQGNDDQVQCHLDSLTVIISTYTTSMCGNLFSQPEDNVTKHVTCISKHDLNQPLPFDTLAKLTTNFRLVDDAECVPTFNTYTISRHYTMTIAVGLQYQNQKFTVKATTPLEILPRIPRADITGQISDHHDEVPIEPLPLYEATEGCGESAPDYDTVYSLTPTSSRPYSFADIGGYGTPLSTSASTSGVATSISELERPTYNPRATWYL